MWRSWDKALSACPIYPGQNILDLGCGPGDISSELVARGALVTGIDRNTEFLEAAKKRLSDCVFEKQDLNNLSLIPASYDGLWCSFTAAYFTNFDSIFARWLKFLKRKAWVCVTDIDDLFGHEPLSKEIQTRILNFYDDAFSKGRYDFRVGRKIQGILEKNGFKVTTVELEDQELSFSGQADPLVKQAWLDRLNRMGGLKTYLNKDFNSFQEEFIKCLTSDDHYSKCKVLCSIGTRL